ncbi:UMP kinase [Candidatus Saccharibacteria bacterium RIFCSPHIGHO2_12_FULL_47_16b]|nr:MAG: UMP kinase [Candidatus Saccharibacteria bacterium RIFCSPHIGHO2_12_FULL_47_16b]OGL39265.1 MAG: UMP kinase [Candidatus Saccharibacteria bacterium RIFCSPLOWO2_02_FULL_46_7]
MKFKRVLLKLSGEQFAGGREHGIDPNFVNNLAKELKSVIDKTKAEIAIVVGAGNFMRGASIAGKGVDRSTGDYMGMLATVINGMALVEALENNDQVARLLSKLRVEGAAEPYIRRRALRHMEKGRVVIIAGGTGNPYFTTDTAAVNAALDLKCNVTLKATKVDGVYDKDPTKHADAKMYEALTHSDALKNPDINVMDNAAISLAMDNHMPIVVFNLIPGNLLKIIEGQAIGTRVSSTN